VLDGRDSANLWGSLIRGSMIRIGGGKSVRAERRTKGMHSDTRADCSGESSCDKSPDGEEAECGSRPSSLAPPKCGSGRSRSPARRRTPCSVCSSACSRADAEDEDEDEDEKEDEDEDEDADEEEKWGSCAAWALRDAAARAGAAVIRTRSAPCCQSWSAFVWRASGLPPPPRSKRSRSSRGIGRTQS
jgi:hypothetical protein